MARLKRKATGDSGDGLSYDNQFQMEYLAELQGRQGALNYHKMISADPQVAMILRMHNNPIRSCNWDIEDIDEATTQETKAMELARHWFFDKCKLPFKTLLGQILSFLPYGHSIFEIVWQPLTFDGQVYMVPKLEQRMQTSIEEIKPTEGYIKQIKATGELTEIPIEDLVFFIHDQQGDDWRGQSILRPSYRYFRDKQVYRQILGIGAQRYALGVPSMKVPAGVDIDSKEYAAVEDLLQNFCGFNEEAYMIYSEGFEFSIEKGSFEADKILSIVKNLDESIAMSVLTQFIMLGQGGNGGAYALGQDQSDMFLDGINYVVELIEETLHRYVIRPFLDINFGDSVSHERIRIKGLNLNKKAGRELAETLEKYKNAGFIKATIEDEQHVRKVNNLPELSEEEIQMREEDRMNAREALNNPQPQTIPPGQQPPPAPPKNLKLSEKDADDVKRRNEFIDRETDSLTKFMQANLQLIKDKLLADIRNTLRRGSVEIRGLDKLDLQNISKYRAGLEKKIAFYANHGWNEMRSKAKRNKVKLAEDLDPRELPDKVLQQYVKNHASEVVEDQAFALKHKAVYTAQNGSLKGLSINQTMANVSKVVDELIESNKVIVGADLAVAASINFGGSKFNESIKDEIHAYRFVAVDDSNTTQICKSCNGKIYAVDSIELAEITPPLHARCRSYMVPVYKDEDEPSIDNYIPPPTILKQKTIF